MIDLTPLDVRNKRGDFKKIMRGYDPPEVDVFLELVAERLEALVRENLQLRERTQTLQSQVEAQAGREQAVQDALVTAQELRADMQAQTQREAEHMVKEAEVEARRLLAEADAEVRSRLRGIERRLDQGQDALLDLERRRARFLKEFRSLLERELDVVHVEEGRAPLEERAIDLDLGGNRSIGSDAEPPTEVAAEAEAADTPTAVEPGPTATMAEEVETVEPDAGSAADATPQAVADVAAVEVPEPVATPVVTTPSPGDDGSRAAAVEAPAPPPQTPATGSGGVEPPRREPAPTPHVTGAPDSAAGPSHPPTPPAGPPTATATATPGDAAAARPTPRPTAPPPAVGSEPSALELELMAGAGRAGPVQASERFPDVPNLETVLAEAGMESDSGVLEVQPPPPEELAPPPAPGVKDDGLILFDPNEREREG